MRRAPAGISPIRPVRSHSICREHPSVDHLRKPSMFRVTREIDFCYGHRLLNYDGKCKYLHGHNGRAVIAIESPRLDARGMVLDFSDIKRVVINWIDQNLDHRMILHRDDPARAVLEQLGEPIYLVDTNPT